MKAKLIIIDDSGVETVVEQDLGSEKVLGNMNAIENFVVSLKTSIMPKMEQTLLEKVVLSDEQLAGVKKKTA